MRESVLDYLAFRFQKNGMMSGATLQDIIFATKIKRFELVLILEELIAEDKIPLKTGAHVDMYLLKVK